MLNVIGIGDNVCDKYRNTNMMYPGGQALNFAVYCKQMGMNSSYMGVFGDDDVAKHIIKTLNELDIDISQCKHVNGENGYAVVDIIDGDRVFVFSNKGGVSRTDPLVISSEHLEYLKNFQIIHTSNNSYINSQLDKLATLDTVISYDFSTSWKDLEATKSICGKVDFAFMSCSDLSKSEIKETMNTMYNYGASIVVATRGAEGSIIYDGDIFFSSKPELVEAVDTLGAGDSYAAAFVTSYVSLIGKKRDNAISKDKYIELVNKCIGNANVISGKTCMTKGAFGYGTKLV